MPLWKSYTWFLGIVINLWHTHTHTAGLCGLFPVSIRLATGCGEGVGYYCHRLCSSQLNILQMLKSSHETRTGRKNKRAAYEQLKDFLFAVNTDSEHLHIHLQQAGTHFFRSLSFLPLAVRLWACSSWAAAFLLPKELWSSSRCRFLSSRVAFSSAWSRFSCSKRPWSCNKDMKVLCFHTGTKPETSETYGIYNSRAENGRKT